MASLKEVQEELREAGDEKTAALSQKFFKTGPGEYGEGDLFRGIRVPVLRGLAKKHEDRALAGELIASPYHEDRLLALMLLARLFAKANEVQRAEIFDFYLANTRYINNWDLVDSSAGGVVGAFLFDKERQILDTLARSSSLWERRIAIIATSYFISHREYADTLKIGEILLMDKEDLIHKAVGWMLREVGKRDLATEEEFLMQHYKRMPRTMLRYAIEKFSEEKRLGYLKGTF